MNATHQTTTPGTHQTLVGTCGICLASTAVDAAGRLVLHGYKRPGWGHVNGRCFGVGYEPYERSTAANADFRDRKVETLADQQATLLKHEQRDISVLYWREAPYSRHGEWRTFAVGVTEPFTFERAFEERVRGLERAIEQTESWIRQTERMIRDFVLTELSTETRADALAREQKAERAKERAAKKAVRQAKADALAARKAKAAEKLADVSARLVAELEALHVLADVTNDIRGSETAVKARDIVAKYAKECRKTPKVTIRAEKLNRERLFVDLGLATREPHGDRVYVRYSPYEIGGNW